jgi:hypothetical protein
VHLSYVLLLYTFSLILRFTLAISLLYRCNIFAKTCSESYKV